MIDYLLHINVHIKELINHYHGATYAILFGIVFAETGLVVLPFLPGDSLLFAVGIFTHPSQNALNFPLTFLVFMLAAFVGDNVNYFIGKTFGHKLFRNENSKIFKKSNLEATHEFFEKHGKRTIVLARFVPVVRTFAPFVAGMGDMPYKEFMGFSILASFLWVGLFLGAGFVVSTIPAVQTHFHLAVLIMVVVTGAPLLWEIYRGYKERKAAHPDPVETK